VSETLASFLRISFRSRDPSKNRNAQLELHNSCLSQQERGNEIPYDAGHESHTEHRINSSDPSAGKMHVLLLRIVTGPEHLLAPKCFSIHLLFNVYRRGVRSAGLEAVWSHT